MSRSFTQTAILSSSQSLLNYPTFLQGVPERFDVSAIGLLDRSRGDEEPRVLFSSMLDRTLEQDDILVLYGRDEDLDALQTAVVNLQGQERSSDAAAREDET